MVVHPHYFKNMLGLEGFISRVSRAQTAVENYPAIIADIVSENESVLLQLNKDQMLSGVDVDEKYFTPSYLNDPYFSSTEKAVNYMNYKDKYRSMYDNRIKYNLFPAKPAEIPNLILVGTFMNSMFITASGNAFTIGATYMESDTIERKYDKPFGVSSMSARWFWQNFLLPGLRTAIYGVR